jgi:hypothetical protein
MMDLLKPFALSSQGFFAQLLPFRAITEAGY